MKKLLRIINGCCFFVCMAVAALLILPEAFGISVYTIVSGSMEPAIGVGSLIYVQPVLYDEIRKGDVITFTLSGGRTVATHRVMKTDRKRQLFWTKGDANETEDAGPVAYKNVIGKVTLAIPRAGYLLLLGEDTEGKLAAAGVIAALSAAEMLFCGGERKEGMAVEKI